MPGPSAWIRAARWAAGFGVLLALAIGLRGPLRDALTSESALLRDEAELLTAAQRASIVSQHAFLRTDHGIDYRVETVRGAGDLDAVAAARFRELEIGSTGRGGRGLLLLIDAEQDQVRLEGGRALEGSFPDAFVAWVEQRQMVPFFQAGRVGDGILAASELLVARVQREQASGGFAELAAEGSSGGGARTQARIGVTPDPAAREGPDVAAGETLAGTYRDCRPEPARIDATGERAVIRYPIEARRCAPWFLVRAGSRWRLDLASASSAIRFGRDNGWHFAARAEHPYAFAFTDWRIDRSGYPRG